MIYLASRSKSTHITSQFPLTDWPQSPCFDSWFYNLTTMYLPLWPRSVFSALSKVTTQLVSCVTVFPEDVYALYYSVSSIMTPGFMSPSATFIASDILLLPLMDDNIPLNKPEQNLNLCRGWNVNLCVFCFRLAALPLHLHPQPAWCVCHLRIARSRCCWCAEKSEAFL